MRLQQRPNPHRRRSQRAAPPPVEVPPPVETPPAAPRRSRARAALFVGLTAACLTVAIGYAALAIRRDAVPPTGATAAAAAGTVRVDAQPRDVLYLRSNGDALRLMATLPADGAAPAVSDVL